jgi:catechol 2,3-dioxygenase-like lactoylglutathione lyase family enzyme
MGGLRLDHLAFPCADVEATLRFHVELLGFALSSASCSEGRLTVALAMAHGPTIGFTCGDGIAPLPPARPRGDSAHVGLVAADAAERERWKRRLAERGVRFTVEDHGPDERLYFADPNGVVFEIEAASPPPAQTSDQAREVVRQALARRPPSRPAVSVAETFFSLEVGDMDRATGFYVAALGATVAFASPRWSSLHVAGVRLGLAPVGHGAPDGRRTGLHFAVDDLAAACAAVERAGGRAVSPETEVAPGVRIAEVVDTEGNLFTLTQR